MNDMTAVIIPKSDQINADDLLAGPRTITITRVNITPGTEQPVAISFEGDNGKPWKCCKSMSRVLVSAWGADANDYIGRSVTLYCDPKVKWGGMEVGGIRISHLSHIERDMVMALTATKGKKTPYMVKPLRVAASQPKPAAPATDDADPLRTRVDGLIQALVGCSEYLRFQKIEEKARQLLADIDVAERSDLKDLAIRELSTARGRFVPHEAPAYEEADAS